MAMTKNSDLFIYVLNKRPSEPGINEWIHQWPPEHGDMSVAVYDEAKSYFLRISNYADFVIANDRRQIGVWAPPTTSLETLRHLLLDQVLPRVLAHPGRLVLHGGAVKIGDEAIAFVGETGSGKSTLTASFHAASYPPLSDDCLIITGTENGVLCQPTYPCIRLWPDAISNLYAQEPKVAPMAHYSNKQRLILDIGDKYKSLQSPLTAIYLLAPEPLTKDISIFHKRLSPAEACIEIIRNSFQLDPTDSLLGAAILEEASNIAETVPLFALYYKRDYSLISDVIKYIVDTLFLSNGAQANN